MQTKNGREFTGTNLQTGYGSARRWSTEIEHGGHSANGADWYVNGNLLREDGWRAHSQSRIAQLFSKFGYHGGHTDVHASLAVADDTLTGNGLQELRLLDTNWRSIYTQPDITKNRSALLNLTASHELSSHSGVSANAFFRRLTTSTVNGDVNAGALDQSLYQPDASERAALSAAGFRGFRTAGETMANTPFPFWRCLGQARRAEAVLYWVEIFAAARHADEGTKGDTSQFMTAISSTTLRQNAHLPRAKSSISLLIDFWQKQRFSPHQMGLSAKS